MGTWSGEPFGNDSAADWAWELADAKDWSTVREVLEVVLQPTDYIDEDDATLAIAAAEVVAHGLGRPTQDDAYTEEVVAFAKRAGRPSDADVDLARRALEASVGATSGLRELWEESDPAEWQHSIAALEGSLGG